MIPQKWTPEKIAKYWSRIPTVTFQRKYIVLLSLLSIVGFYVMIALVDAGLVLWVENAFPWFAYIRDVTDFPLKDKFAHLFSSGGFALILNFYFCGRKVHLAKVPYYLGTLIVTIIITTEEFSQIFFPLRSFDLLDLTFDLIGIHLFGNLAYPYIPQSLANSGQPWKSVYSAKGSILVGQPFKAVTNRCSIPRFAKDWGYISQKLKFIDTLEST